MQGNIWENEREGHGRKTSLIGMGGNVERETGMKMGMEDGRMKNGFNGKTTCMKGTWCREINGFIGLGVKWDYG